MDETKRFGPNCDKCYEAQISPLHKCDPMKLQILALIDLLNLSPVGRAHYWGPEEWRAATRFLHE